jgi:hypothetical protein
MTKVFSNLMSKFIVILVLIRHLQGTELATKMVQGIIQIQ